MMKVVFLDSASIGTDIDLNAYTLPNLQWQFFQQTSPQQIVDRIIDADIVITNKVVLNATTIAAAKQLKFIAVIATGTNNIDLDAASAGGIVVSNATAYGNDSIAQHTISLMLALTTQLLPYQNSLRQGDWSRSSFFSLLDHPISQLAGKTLGIVGYGALGQSVAAIAKAFKMKVIALNSLNSTSTNVPRYPLTELLKRSDILSLHCPLSDHNFHMINRQRLQLMPNHALLINCARGGLVDESALAEALQEGVIAGAALDVLEQEPPPADHPLINHKLPNLIVTPHIAWASKQARITLLQQVMENIAGFIDGKPLRVVNS